MSTYSNLYCKLFIDINERIDEVYKLIKDLVSGTQISIASIESQSCFIDLVKNDDFNEVLTITSIDGFLYYRYYLDIEPSYKVEQGEYIKEVSKLLHGLWGMKIRSVAACEFEDELPQYGGYNPDR